MDIEKKTKEELQNELLKLLQENNSLKALIEKRASELILANEELVFQNREKEKRADELAMINKELTFQNNEKENSAAELIIAHKELFDQHEQKEKRVAELVTANKDLVFQNREKEKLADELILANNELVFQNRENEKRADELAMINKELAFQNNEKKNHAAELNIAYKELANQNEQKEKRAAELVIANKELIFQNREKEKRADELVVASKELTFQNDEKEKHAAELINALNELANQNEQKEKRAAELGSANKELVFQNREKEKRIDELVMTNKELAFQNELNEIRAMDLPITNKKLQQLIQLNKDKDKFFAIITHDLKSPLNSIVGLSLLLIDQIKEKQYEKIEEFADIIIQSSNRATNLLMNLMAWAQSQSGRMDYNPEYQDIIPLIKDVTFLLNDIAEQKSILITNTLPSSFQVYMDKEMISTILRNLISNAIKFTPFDGKITISTVDKLNQLIVSVSDTGVGISNERIDNLFKISDGYSTPGTQNEKGTGLGLILCKEFINKNHGEIWVESQVGIGTTFYFSLPLSLANSQNIDELIE